jgi:PTH1 family peptidyl-tRNA hydrolase
LIVGLGNPGNEYINTRHNIGFMAIEKLADSFNMNFSKTKFEGIYSIGQINDEKVILLKPQTYMNLSGESIVQFKKFYKIANSKIIVIYDDIDIKLGNIRIKKQGGPGTHNGMKSVTEKLNTQKFIRIRIGSGFPKENENLAEYVLKKLKKDEINILEDSTNKTKEAICEIISGKIELVMNKINIKEE